MSSPARITPIDKQRASDVPALRVQLIRDLAIVAILAIISLVAGLVIDRFAKNPLPIVYKTPEQRFDAELTTLVTAPPFKIAPAATVGLPEFRAALSGKQTLILDARPSLIYAQGHVPGALNLSRQDFARDYRRLAPTLKPAMDKPIIVYCSGGDCHDSRMVANAMLTLGYSNVSVFTGGWDVWSANKLPATTGNAP
jgi:rhodanese-related sulfurtransferase